MPDQLQSSGRRLTENKCWGDGRKGKFLAKGVEQQDKGLYPPYSNILRDKYSRETGILYVN
jgi:hypothetical protein